MHQFRARHRRTLRVATPVAAVVLAGAVVAAGLTVTGGPDAHADTASGCTPVKLVVVPGSWETNPNNDPNVPQGQLQDVVNRIQQRFGDRVSTYWVPYAASVFDQGQTYNDSKESGIKGEKAAIQRIAASCPGTRFVGIGYSQGADANGDVADAIGNGKGPIPPDRYIAGGDVADPDKGTPGEVNLGTQQPNTKGIAGGRSPGFGALSGRVANVCIPGDMYCSMPQDVPLVDTIGAVFSHIGIANAQDSAENEVSSGMGNGTDGKPADLSVIPKEVTQLEAEAKKHDTGAVKATADNLIQLISAAQSLERLVASPLIINALLSTPQGSQTYVAGQVLQDLNKVDFVTLTKDVRAADNAAMAKDIDTAMTSAIDAGNKIAPLAGVPADQTAKATRVAEGLRPTAVLSQASNIIGGITRIDYTGITQATQTIPNLVARGDIRGLYTSLTTIEDKLTPLAETGTNVDLMPLAALLTMWPEGSQERAVGDALVILNRVNWVRIVKDLRTIQDKLAQVNPNSPPQLNMSNPTQALNNFFGVDLLGMVPMIADLTQHGLEVAGVKTPYGDINHLLTTDLTPQEVVKEGVEVAIFYGTHVHTSYGSTPVDGTGRSAHAVLADWLGDRIAG